MVGRVVSIDINLKLIGSILAVAALNDGRFSITCSGYVDTAFYCVISACTVKRHFEIITLISESKFCRLCCDVGLAC
jgi:hypothetical protein